VHTIFNAVKVLKLFDYQQRLLDDDSKQIIALWGRCTGKSFIAGLKAIRYARKHSKSNVLVVAPSTMLVRVVKAWSELYLGYRYSFSDRIREFFRWLIGRKQIVTSNSIFLRNGSRIDFVSAQSKQLIGLSPDLIEIDNCAFIKKETFETIHLMRLAKNAGIVVFSTATGNIDYLRKMWFDDNFSKHHAKTSANPMINKAFIEQTKIHLGLKTFKQEFEAEFIK